jgi:hypothetical protein
VVVLQKTKLYMSVLGSPPESIHEVYSWHMGGINEKKKGRTIVLEYPCWAMSNSMQSNSKQCQPDRYETRDDSSMGHMTL